MSEEKTRLIYENYRTGFYAREGTCNSRNVTEAEYRAHHGMKAWPCKCPAGYEVVDFRHPECGEMYLDPYGEVSESILMNKLLIFPILRKRKLEIEWVTPTDEDARHRPMCTFFGMYWEHEMWKSTTEEHGPDRLLGVIDHYICDKMYVDGYGRSWKNCRMDAKQREAWK
jgi:hypothetical protein